MAQTISVQDFIRSASQSAYHFGFSPLDTLRNLPECKNCTQKIQHKATAQERKNDSMYGMLTSGICSYFDGKLNGIEGPSLFYSIEHVPRSLDLAVSFHVLNVKKSVAEALLIQTIRSMLLDLNVSNHSVHINSLGDQDSVTRYIRDLTNFLRKRIDDIPPQARELMKEHPIHALMHLVEKDHDIVYKSPNPLEYLTDMSRKHFREIVEFLDMSGIPFEIDSKLIGHHDCYSDALFAIEVLDANSQRLSQSPLHIRGGRYSTFVSKMSKTKIPAVGAVVILKDKKIPEHIPVPRAKKTPDVYLVQLGFGPKVKSLLLIEELKQAGMSVYQDVTSDSLSSQLRDAESKNARFALIIGHKEFIEGTIIVRDLKLRNQECIPLTQITSRLKTLVS